MKGVLLQSGLALACVLLAACGGGEGEMLAVTITGTVEVPGGHEGGVVHIAAYQAWSLEGELRHPLQRISSWELDDTKFSVDLDYPAHLGEGLAVHAWVDTDGDGAHCSPDAKQEPGGFAVSDEVASAMEFTVRLTTPCAGPDWFFPGSPAG